MPPIGLPPNLSEDPMNQAILARVFAEMALAGVVELVRSSTDMMLRERAIDAMDPAVTLPRAAEPLLQPKLLDAWSRFTPKKVCT
jgi:hypothetical protein